MAEPGVALLSAVDGRHHDAEWTPAPASRARHVTTGFPWLAVLCAGAGLFCTLATMPFLGTFLSAQTVPLDECLTKAGVPFVTKDSASWPAEITPQNQRVAYTPALVTIPQSIQHIQDSVRCGAAAGLRVTPKAGGHSFASFGLGGEDGHVVIALDRMYNVTLQDTTAIVQPGARIGHVATELHRLGKRGFAHGSCPGVGMAGLSLHGGIGMSTRMHGLTLDWLVGAKVVLANGTLVDCTETHNSDLFWALRGAGSSFGVVAELRFDTFSTDVQLTHFTVLLPWDEHTAAAGLAALYEFTYNAPRQLSMLLEIDSIGLQYLEGQFYGDEDSLRRTIQPLLDSTGASLDNVNSMTWMEANEFFAFEELDATYPYAWHETFDSSHAVTKLISEDQVREMAVHLYRNMNKDSLPSDARWSYMLDMYGGQHSVVANGSAGSFAHRDRFMIHQFTTNGTIEYLATDGAQLMVEFKDKLLRGIDDGQWGLYANYVDLRVDPDAARRLYYGESLPRLQRIKEAVDRKDLFWNPHGIQPRT